MSTHGKRESSSRFIGAAIALGPAILLVLTACTPAAVGGATTINTNSQPTGISVSGQGEITIIPDVAVIQVGVEARAETVAEATDQATKAMDAVVAELKAGGVEEKDIKTVQFTIRQDRRFTKEGEPIIAGYIVQNRVTAKVRKVEDTGRILERVAQAGEDFIRIDSVSFTVDDPTGYHKQLRALAMADAKAKAEQLAKLAGAQLGKVLYVQEAGIPLIMEAGFPQLGRKGGDGPLSAPPFISPGETEAQLHLQVRYAIQ